MDNKLKERFEAFKKEMSEDFTERALYEDPINKFFINKIMGDESLNKYNGTNAEITHNIRTIDNILTALFYNYIESSNIEVKDYNITNIISVGALKNTEDNKKYSWIITFSADSILNKHTVVDYQKELFQKIEENIKIYLNTLYDNLEITVNPWFGINGDQPGTEGKLVIDVTFNGKSHSVFYTSTEKDGSTFYLSPSPSSSKKETTNLAKFLCDEEEKSKSTLLDECGEETDKN